MKWCFNVKNIRTLHLRNLPIISIEGLILTLRNDCAMEWDKIFITILKAHRYVIVPRLTFVCNLTLSMGIFPRGFKKSIIHPIYKSGDRKCRYLPIAVVTALYKILERLMNNCHMELLERYNVLSSSQYK